MRTVTSYQADDGQSFDSREACEAHEASSFPRQFVGLTLDQVEAALTRADVKLADAFEVIGGRIAEIRRQSGEKRRRARGASAETPISGTSESVDGSTSPPIETAPVTAPAQPKMEAPRSPAFERGRKAFLAGKPETIPGGLLEADWDDWAAGYAHQSGRGEALEGAAAAEKTKGLV